VQTAEGALTETHSILQRMRDLSVQAANDGGLNTEAKKNIQSEITQLKAEINRISDTTTFNGKKLLDGSFTAAFQVGANKGETITVGVGAVGAGMDTTGLGVNGVDVTGSSSLTVTQTGAVADDQGSPAAGTNVITGDFTQAATFDTLKGTIAANGKTFDLSSVKYLAGDTAAQRLTKLNAAAQTALGTVSGTPFTTQTTVSLTFTGDTPAVGSTAAQAAKASPVYSGASGASSAIDLLDTAIKTVSTQRADLGAIQNRFDHTISNLNVAVENLTASESRIRDADMAQEMVQFTRNQILSQAGTAMLAQANQSSQGVLSLLR
jgi:flagellin